jgi:glucose/arabinose dehydrogenase
MWILLAIGMGVHEDPVLARSPNDTLRIPLRPALKGFGVRPAFEGLGALPPATRLAKAPGDTNRVFVLAQDGRAYVISDARPQRVSTFLDLRPRVRADSECGLLGIAFHPLWRQNGWVYVFYSTDLPTADGPQLHQRIARFQIDPADANRLLPDSEQPLISQRDPGPEHNGGDLRFGPDGYLYISLGDGGGAFDMHGNAQHVQKDFFSGILRIDVDRKTSNLEPNPHPAIHAGTYRVPRDNPLVGRATYFGQVLGPSTVRSEFYAVGLRNPYRIAFDPSTGRLFANDVGQNRREEINRIESGGNYGWIFFEGSIAWPFGIPDEPYSRPLYEYEHEGGRVAITGGAWYHGDAFPDLKGSFVFADLGGPIGAMSLDADGRPSVRWIAEHPGITDVEVGLTGDEIYFTTISGGAILRLTLESRDGPQIPPRLSETGIFADLATLRPNPGIEPYEVNVPFWSDGTSKRRWFSLPQPDLQIGFHPTEPWGFPPGSLWIKHFEIPSEAPNTPPLRIETRVMVCSGPKNEIWGASYRWNREQTDAELVPDSGLDETLKVSQGGRLVPKQWRYPSQRECIRCHNASAGGVLGFGTAQLNRDVNRGGGMPEVRKNQIQWLIEEGYIANPPRATGHLPVLAAPGDESWSLDYRVHSYLTVNCAYCHQAGGPSRAQWTGALEVPLNQSGLVGSLALNNLQDIYAMEPTFLVAPGDLKRSSLYRRIAEDAPYHMPPLATHVLDASAALLIERWIVGSLPGREFTYRQWSDALLKAHPATDLRPEADPDVDGLVNEMEFLLGESPVSPVVAWRPSLVGTPGNWRMHFIRRANLRFEVQSARGVGGPWSAVECPENLWFVGVSDETVEVPLPSSDSSQYFRVLVSGP